MWWVNQSEHESWFGLLKRCLNPKDKAFPGYGGRGIAVCDRWMSFDEFLADMGNKPSPNHSLDRIDNNKGYCPENCRWADAFMQNGNRRTSDILTMGGKSQCRSAWAREVGLSEAAIRFRIKNGMSVEEALTRPRQDSRSKPAKLETDYQRKLKRLADGLIPVPRVKRRDDQ